MNDNSGIYFFYYGHGLLSLLLPWLYGYLFYLERHTHAAEKKKKRFISVSNKETVADIYPAELKADHQFNFAEQTHTLFYCVRGSVCCYIKSVSTVCYVHL